MNTYTFGEEWLAYIESDIRKKYGIKKPVFTINGKLASMHEDLINWIDDCLWNEEDISDLCWVKYKRISEDVFDLKRVNPDPPEEVCRNIVDAYINLAKRKTKNPYFEMGEKIFNEQDARKELIEELKDGYPVIEHSFDLYPDSVVGRNRIIYKTYFAQDEIACDIKKGYLVLEIKD